MTVKFNLWRRDIRNYWHNNNFEMVSFLYYIINAPPEKKYSTKVIIIISI